MILKNIFEKRKFLQLCGMEERNITHIEAWDDFEANILPSIRVHWIDMNTLHQARRDRAKGRLGKARIERILKTYAAGRYRFEERVMLIEP